MAYIDKILVDGVTYDVQDSIAQQAIADANKDSLLHDEEIDDTVQTIVFDGNGNVQSITHSRGGSAIRTDTFTFGTNTITEVRALSSGETLTIVTNTVTLQTTVTYADA